MHNFVLNLVQINNNKTPTKVKNGKALLTRFQTFHFTTGSLQATQESLNNKILRVFIAMKTRTTNSLLKNEIKQNLPTRFQTFYQVSTSYTGIVDKPRFHMVIYRDENEFGEWHHAIYMLDFKTHPDFMKPSVALFFSGSGSKFSSDSSEEPLDVDGAEFGLLTSRVSSFRNR